jgi:hypothetical protein
LKSTTAVGDKGTFGEGKGEAVVKARKRKIKTKKQSVSQRYAKVTNLLVKGRKGAAFELAIAEWER